MVNTSAILSQFLAKLVTMRFRDVMCGPPKPKMRGLFYQILFFRPTYSVHSLSDLPPYPDVSIHDSKDDAVESILTEKPFYR